MHQITIRLPSNRDFAGTLKLEDAKGKLIAGPFQICARAHDEPARANGNPDRLSVLPFGDMPLGEYQIIQIIPSGPGTPYDGDEFGSAGIVFLQPRHGEGVLADANGRFIFLIHGGALSRNGALRPTQDGSLRLSNRDQRKLVGLLRRVGVAACRCHVTNSGSARYRVATASPAHSGPLPAGAAAASLAETSRRSWLRTILIAAGAFASVPSLLLFSPPKAHGEGGGTNYSPKTDPQATGEEKQREGGNKRAIDQLKAIGTDTNETKRDSGIGIDTGGKRNTTDTSTYTFVSPPRTEPPLVIPEKMANDPDVQKLNQYQEQLKQDQTAAARAQADYNAQKQADPNANMAAMLAAQDKLNATKNMVKYETNQVKAKLPALPTATTPPNKP
jgi:hypothetical protein